MYYICGCVWLCACEKVKTMLSICQMWRVPAVSMCEHTVLLFCSPKSDLFKAAKQKALPACPNLSHFTINRNTPSNTSEHGSSNLCSHLSLCCIYPSLQKIIMHSFGAEWNGTWCNTQTYGVKSKYSFIWQNLKNRSKKQSVKADKGQSRVMQSS